MIRESRCVSTVLKSTTRRRTSTGVAERIEVSTEEKCGGAVESGAKINQVVSSLSTRAKMTRMKTMTPPDSRPRASI